LRAQGGQAEHFFSHGDVFHTRISMRDGNVFFVNLRSDCIGLLVAVLTIHVCVLFFSNADSAAFNRLLALPCVYENDMFIQREQPSFSRMHLKSEFRGSKLAVVR
jgi:hypothetical protein